MKTYDFPHPLYMKNQESHGVILMKDVTLNTGGICVWCVSHQPFCQRHQPLAILAVSNRSTSARDAASAYLPSDAEYKIFARNSNLVATTLWKILDLSLRNQKIMVSMIEFYLV